MRVKNVCLLMLLSACPTLSYAITCTLSGVSSVNFGAVSPIATATNTASMTFGYSCTKGVLETLAGVNMCVNIGASTSTAQINPRTMTYSGPPSSTMTYQLYQNTASGGVWGSQYVAGSTPVMVNLGLLSALIPTTGTLTVFGQLSTPQVSATPGTYTDLYTAVNASVTYNVGLLVPPSGCGTTAGPSFTFNVLASVTKLCTITTSGNINLGSVSPTAVNSTSNNTLNVTCTNSTPYTIGLVPSNANTAGSGVMSSTATGSNSDKVPYQLTSTPGPTGTVWGSDPTHVVAGSGTGSAISYPVYATVPTANYTPDNYSDTVTVNVTY